MRRQIDELGAQKKELAARLEEKIRAFTGGGFFFRKRQARMFRDLFQEMLEYVDLSDRLWDTLASNHNSIVFKSLQWKTEKLTAEYSHLKTILRSFLKLEESLKLLIARIEKQLSGEDLEKLREFARELEVVRYEDFEQRFRGTTDEVRERLSFYLAFFRGRKNVIDLGCGRGEFLELLRGEGIAARGVDLSESMLVKAREAGLDVIRRDALQFLTELPEKSAGGIFSSQFAEHLEFRQLQEIVRQSFRVLEPGGVLVLETLNPLSLFAVSRIFFLDPTHSQPLHPEFMRYLLETSGFGEVEVIYRSEPEKEKLAELPARHPDSALLNDNFDKLNGLLYSHLEYCVKGVK
jgi:O-antigen chain-terminating methyltransferase